MRIPGQIDACWVCKRNVPVAPNCRFSIVAHVDYLNMPCKGVDKGTDAYREEVWRTEEWWSL